MEKFIALYDLHWGYENRGGHKVALHDPKALSVALQFMEDFKPKHVILGGDILDCGSVSHHNKHKAGAVEGLRLFSDAVELRDTLLEPIERIAKGRLVYHVGNHEDWLNDLVSEQPGLSGIVDIANVLKLGKRWEVIPCGEASRLGKLVFIHGDQIKGSEFVAKNAVVAYEANVRFGHHHTFQVHTKTSAVDLNGHTGVAIPCLCKKNPSYGGGAPNKWMQGFSYGYVDPKTGYFNDYFPIIINGHALIEGTHYVA